MAASICEGPGSSIGAASLAALGFAEGWPWETGWAKAAPKRDESKNRSAYFVGFMTGLDFRFLSDRHTPSHAEGLWGDFQSRGGLLALVLAALDHADHVPDQLEIETAVGRNLLRGMVVFNVIFQDAV